MLPDCFIATRRRDNDTEGTHSFKLTSWAIVLDDKIISTDGNLKLIRSYEIHYLEKTFTSGRPTGQSAGSAEASDREKAGQCPLIHDPINTSSRHVDAVVVDSLERRCLVGTML